METKLPSIPKSLEAEQAYLGSLIMDSSSWDQVSHILEAKDFFDMNNKIIYSEIYDLASAGQVIDVVVLEDCLRSKGVLDKVGGIQYLGQLARKVPTSAHIKAYADIIKEKSIMRELINISTRTIQTVHQSEQGDVKNILDKAESDIFGITEMSSVNDGLKKIGPVVHSYIETVYDKKNNDELDYLLTGYKEFDKLVAGLQKSDLIIIAGRPSMGKTAFAMNIAQDIVFKQHKKVAFFSLEMSAQSIALRMLSSLSSVSQQKIRTGDYEASPQDTKSVTSAIEMMNDCDFYIDDTAAISPMDLRSKARRLKRESGIDMIVVDYLQLMSIPRYSENRVNEIAEVTRSLKAIAKELDIPVVALSQLNRGVESRNDKRPFLSDLRESGSIEQDADLIIFLYREEVYDSNTDQKNIAEIRVEKHRNGPTGFIKLTFVPHCTRFEDHHPQVYDGVGEY
ncbi:MAG: Replicative DNA helicase [Gammaproteobacteria bacterium]|nr:MAG: replicative DNA helicase [Gammaproteobacteria bacterium TMED257]CAI8326977.1 MAG: Replicative DNA helicase [Gammaproteobacteria bacterium]|tara:strand:+ start:2674 stop:4032 length:1359 start_codon:yes stop_codon:yes gene_type:complete